LAGAVGGGIALAGCKKKDESTGKPAGTAATPPAQPAMAVPPEMAKFPEKTDLILLTDRPPQLETPIKYFATDITPNDAFFVRYHLADIPTMVDLSKFRLAVRGHVNSPLSLSVDELKSGFEAVVDGCSEPVLGEQPEPVRAARARRAMGHGAMGTRSGRAFDWRICWTRRA